MSSAASSPESIRRGIHPTVASGSFGFSLTPTRSMVRIFSGIEANWTEPRLEPYGPISLSPAAGVLNYGQGVFEGMKARRTQDNRIILFRPHSNAVRINQGARRLCMPEVPAGAFLKGLGMLVADNADYVPPAGEGSLYLRPLLIGTGAILGVQPAPEYTLLMYASPVGSYFKGGKPALSLLVRRDVVRAAMGGVGNVKAIGNYAPSILPSRQVKSRGYDEVIYLDSKSGQLLEEMGSANIFLLVGNTLHTPSLRGSILPGVTRHSILELARSMGLNVEEGDVNLSHLAQATEMFATGTAAGVMPIGTVEIDGEKVELPRSIQPDSMTSQLSNGLNEIQRGDRPDEFGWVVPLEELL